MRLPWDCLRHPAGDEGRDNGHEVVNVEAAHAEGMAWLYPNRPGRMIVPPIAITLPYVILPTLRYKRRGMAVISVVIPQRLYVMARLSTLSSARQTPTAQM